MNKLRIFKTSLILLALIVIVDCSDQCWDKFDQNLRNQCSRGKRIFDILLIKLLGEWMQKYFYDHASMTCQLFWYDGKSYLLL